MNDQAEPVPAADPASGDNVTVEGADVQKGDELEVTEAGEPGAEATVEGTDVQPGDTVEVTGEPQAIAGANPEGAVVPPEGVPPEGDPVQAEPLPLEPAIKPAEPDDGSATAKAAAAIGEAGREAAANEADALDDRRDANPGIVEEPSHPEPVPTNHGVIQDNVSTPGVEKTLTRGDEGIVTSAHDTTEARVVDEAIDAGSVESKPE